VKFSQLEKLLFFSISVSFITNQPIWADEIDRSTKDSQLGTASKPSTRAADLLAQEAIATIVKITGVKINSTDAGLEVVLESDLASTTVPMTRSEGNTFIAEVKNAVLALPEGPGFNAANPAMGVKSVSVIQLDEQTVRVSVMGVETVPTATVRLSEPATAQQTKPSVSEEGEEEVVVTGDRPGSSYFVPKASTATRTDTSILDTPQSIQVIPRQILEDQQTLRVDDALRNVSGVSGRLDAFGTSTSLTLRGFTTDNFTAGSILRDGFRVNDNLGTQETANVEQIEIIKGPASVLYGQSDPGGIINLVTKRPLSKPFYNLKFQAGSFGLIRPSIDISGPLTQDASLRYRLNMAYQREDGFRGFDTDTSRFFIAPVLSWDISDRTNLTLVLEYTDEKNPFDLGLPAFGNQVVDVPRDRIVSEPNDFLKNRSLTFGYDFKHKFNDNWTLNHGFRYVTQDYNVLVALPFNVDETTGDITRVFGNRRYQSNDYSIQANVVGKFKTGPAQHTLLAGVDLNFNRFDEKFTQIDLDNPSVLNIFNPVYGTPPPNFNALTPLTPFDTESDRVGAFLQDQIAIGDKFILVGSLRFDSVDFRNTAENTSRSDQAWSPRVGVIYKPIKTVSLYANYSQSFRPNSGQTESGEPLQPEKGSGFEVGVKADLLKSKLFATLSYFDITKRNVSTTDPNNPFFSVATGKQRSQGIELDVTGELAPGWNIIANYAYTNAKITEDNNIPVGNRLFNSPYHSFGLWTTYEIQKGNLQGLGFGLGLNYVGDRAGDLDNSFEVDDYFLANIALFYKRDRWRFGLNINNLFDISYISSTSNSRNFGNSVGAPFSVVGSVSVEF
jgi:iron complex outermembrane recepter protein